MPTREEDTTLVKNNEICLYIMSFFFVSIGFLTVSEAELGSDMQELDKNGNLDESGDLDKNEELDEQRWSGKKCRINCLV